MLVSNYILKGLLKTRRLKSLKKLFLKQLITVQARYLAYCYSKKNKFKYFRRLFSKNTF